MPGTSFPSASLASANSKPIGTASSLLEAFLRDEDERAAALAAVAEKWKLAHRRLWPVWVEAWGMTFSDQYGTYNAETRSWMQRDPAPEKKVTRIELNHMEPILSDIATLQVQDPPNFKATASTDSSAAASASQGADQLTWWLWEQDNYDDINVQLRLAAAVAGNWFLYPFWNASEGRLKEVVVGYEPVFGQPDPVTGLPMSMGMQPVKRKVREGKFEDRLVSCFDALPDPNSKSEWDGEGFIIHERLSLASLRALYPEHKDDLVIDRGTGSNDGTYYSERLKGVSPRTGGMMGSASQEQATETVSVYTVFLRTCEEFYRGRWAIIACGKVLFEADNPVYPTEAEEAKGEEFPPEHWPVWKFTHKLVTGSYWGQGVATRMIGAQRKLNGVASKKLHILKRVSHPTLVKPKRADFVKSDEPDQQINVSDTLQPGSIYYLNSPGVPQELQMEEKLSVEQMERIAGLHSGSRGESEGGDSGTKVRQLFQRDLGRLADPKFRMDKQLARAFSYKLRLWRRHATVDRSIRVVGDNGVQQVRNFNASSIGAGTDVVVYQDSQMPREPSARMIHVEKAIQLKIVDPTDPVTRSQIAALLGFGMSEKQFESTLYADRKRAMNENLEMYDGKQCPVEFWHDDLQDLAAHFAEMNTGRWREATTPAPGDTPDVMMKKAMLRQTFMQHVQAHQMAVQQKSGAAVQPAPGPGQPPAAPFTPSAPSAPALGAPPAPGLDQIAPPPQASAGPPMQMAA